MRVRKLTFVALAVAAGLSLTACNDDDVTGQGDTSSAASESSSGGSASDASGKDGGTNGGKDSAGKDGASSGGQSADNKANTCRTDRLDITAQDATIDGDTEGTVAVTFKNGGSDCALNGFAGVDLKTSAGALSAERSGGASDPMTLKAGESVSFGVTYPVNDSGGSGVKVSSLVVTPPGETKSVSLQWPGGTLPVTDGSGSSVKVGPMGSAGQGGAS
ncbi:DUF4232 domain-containing protein [Streptomyces venezuelae]